MSSSNFNLMLTETTISESLIEMKEIGKDLMTKIAYAVQCLNLETHYYVSFNGGKDCLAAYIILKYFLYCNEFKKDYTLKESYDAFCKNTSSITCDNITFIYFVNDKNFESEEDYFITFSKKEKVDIILCYSSYVCGLNYLVKQNNIQSIVMGTRKDDMKSPADANQIALTLHQASTYPFPKFMRIFPVFNFTYNEIWRLILSSDFDYLSLYEQGFTSIGNKENTKINSFLFDNNRNIYPAWYLKEETSERQFR